MAEKKLSLDAQVNDYWKRRKANGAEGLALLDKCITRFARYRDWDALARFVVASNESNNRAKVVKIIRGAFGNDVSFKADSKHAAGGVFTMHNWPEGAYTLKNTYGMVRQAVQEGVSWDDKAFLKELGAALPDPIKKPKTLSDAEIQKAATRLKKSVDKFINDIAEGGAVVSSGEVLGALSKLYQAEAAAKSTGEVVKKVVNGVSVYEPNF